MRTLTGGNTRKAVREAIKASGLSQGEIAKRMHTDQPTVSGWVTGKHIPSDLEALAKALGQPIVLVYGKQKEAPRPEWAKGLERLMVAGFTRLGVSPDELAAELQQEADAVARVDDALGEVARQQTRTRHRSTRRRGASDRVG